MGVVAVFCRGRIYPSRDYRVLRYWTLSVLELTSVHTSGRINPPPTLDRHDKRMNGKRMNDNRTNGKITTAKIRTFL
ncbi:MAG: hypothetical protein FWG87_06030 [Defluviitaleaceae bacterium]|nr:hypothetical protein [Defluviitaleaceae bacterium]